MHKGHKDVCFFKYFDSSQIFRKTSFVQPFGPFGRFIRNEKHAVGLEP